MHPHLAPDWHRGALYRIRDTGLLPGRIAARANHDTAAGPAAHADRIPASRISTDHVPAGQAPPAQAPADRIPGHAPATQAPAPADHIPGDPAATPPAGTPSASTRLPATPPAGTPSASTPPAVTPAPDSQRRKALRLALILVVSFMMVLDFSIVMWPCRRSSAS